MLVVNPVLTTDEQFATRWNVSPAFTGIYTIVYPSSANIRLFPQGERPLTSTGEKVIPFISLSNSVIFSPTTSAGAIFPLTERVESNALEDIFSDVTAPPSILSVVINNLFIASTIASVTAFCDMTIDSLSPDCWAIDQLVSIVVTWELQYWVFQIKVTNDILPSGEDTEIVSPLESMKLTKSTVCPGPTVEM